MKKLKLLVLIFVAIATTISPTTTTLSFPTPPCNSYGDVNIDGYVTEDDANLTIQYVVGLVNLTPSQKIRADVDGVSGITSVDSMFILQYARGGRTTFPVCEFPTTTTLSFPRTSDERLVELESMNVEFSRSFITDRDDCYNLIYKYDFEWYNQLSHEANFGSRILAWKMFIRGTNIGPQPVWDEEPAITLEQQLKMIENE